MSRAVGLNVKSADVCGIVQQMRDSRQLYVKAVYMVSKAKRFVLSWDSIKTRQPIANARVKPRPMKTNGPLRWNLSPKKPQNKVTNSCAHEPMDTIAFAASLL